MVGKSLSHYKILEELGRGGMGIVYKATDSNLNRTVAIKVLPATALASEDDRARFFREAQAAAQLSHPNVCHVYQVDEAIPVEEGKEPQPGTEKRLYIVMEFIEGETLQDYIKKGPLKLTEAVQVAAQVSEALKAAHAKEIVHRDIKSANVMLTEDGTAKVLDFGLAKTNQSTMLTKMGSTLGTVNYMSPEQARGQDVDGRSDLYSLGTMLYEMISGKLPFAGEYEQAVVYSILNENPEPLTSIRTGVPMQLEWIVDKLLAKEADYRYQTAADLLADLKTVDLSGSGHSRRSMTAMSSASMESSATTMALPQPSASSTPKWIWGSLVGIAVLFLAIGWLLKPKSTIDQDNVVRQLMLELPAFRVIWGPVVSPDAKTLAVGALDTTNTTGIYLINLETSRVEQILGAQGGGPIEFSPDGNRLLFGRRAAGLFSIPVTGGTEQLVAERASDATWLVDGSIVFRRDNELWLQPASGSESRQLTTLDSTEVTHGRPRALPGGRYILFHVRPRLGERLRLSALDLETGERRDLGFGSKPRYLESGHLLYGDGSHSNRGPLMVRPFDVNSLTFTGSEFTWHQDAAFWLYEVDKYGTWYDIFESVTTQASNNRVLYLVDSNGEIIDTVVEGDFDNPRLSPDGRRIALSVEAGDDYLMILDLVSGVQQQITFTDDVDNFAWSSDPERIMLVRNRRVEIWSSRGLAMERALPIENVSEIDWSSDGRYVTYVASGGNNGPLRLYDMESGKDTLLVDDISSDPRFSPDGRFVAYTGFDQDGPHVYVHATTGSEKQRLSLRAEFTGDPVWAKDGKSLFVDAFQDNLVRLPVDISAGFLQTGRGEMVLNLDDGIEFDTADDGSLFLLSDSPVNQQGGRRAEQTVPRLRVIVNWFELVKQRAPPVE